MSGHSSPGPPQAPHALQTAEVAAAELAQLQSGATKVRARQVAVVEADGLELSLEEVCLGEQAVVEGHAQETGESERRQVDAAAPDRDVTKSPPEAGTL